MIRFKCLRDHLLPALDKQWRAFVWQDINGIQYLESNKQYQTQPVLKLKHQSRNNFSGLKSNYSPYMYIKNRKISKQYANRLIYNHWNHRKPDKKKLISSFTIIKPIEGGRHSSNSAKHLSRKHYLS